MDKSNYDIDEHISENHSHCECGCGESHSEHEHTQHCHTHEHHEHHVHHEECSCNHEHHHHEHEHHHEHDKKKECNVSISYHDRSVIASYKFDINVNELSCSDEKLGEFLLDIGSRVESLGGIIGHIKAVVCRSESGKMLSVTYDGEVSENPVEIKKVFIEGVAIVFNVDGETLEDIVSESYETLKNKFNQ